MAWLISKTKDGPAVGFYHLPKTGGRFHVLIDLLSNHLHLHADIKRMIQRHRVVNDSQNAGAVLRPEHREVIRDLEELIFRTCYT